MVAANPAFGDHWAEQSSPGSLRLAYTARPPSPMYCRAKSIGPAEGGGPWGLSLILMYLQTGALRAGGAWCIAPNNKRGRVETAIGGRY